MERNIGSTDLRQQLTEVLRAVREERASYVVETFGRSQAVLVNHDEYLQFLHFREAREAFFDWLDDTAASNAEQNQHLGQDEVRAIIAEARSNLASEASSHKTGSG
jgi:Rps23 Pro-64 3,4-dihydroxylase Tpa1-like proline 4-hydroxylase